MLCAVFVRTLKPGVTYEQFKDAWVPEGLSGSYPAKARVARNVANDRQVITIIEIDVAPAEFRSASASLTRPDPWPGWPRSLKRPSSRESTRTFTTRSRCCAD